MGHRTALSRRASAEMVSELWTASCSDTPGSLAWITPGFSGKPKAPGRGSLLRPGTFSKPGVNQPVHAVLDHVAQRVVGKSPLEPGLQRLVMGRGLLRLKLRLALPKRRQVCNDQLLGLPKIA